MDQRKPKRLDRNAQSWGLFKQHSFWLTFTLTFILLTAVIATLKGYKKGGTVDQSTKRIFNTIITTLILGLGLTFFVSFRSVHQRCPSANAHRCAQEIFKDVAKVIRWRVMFDCRLTAREVDLILGADDLKKLGRLMWESRQKPRISLGCAFWVSHRI